MRADVEVAERATDRRLRRIVGRGRAAHAVDEDLDGPFADVADERDVVPGVGFEIGVPGEVQLDVEATGELVLVEETARVDPLQAVERVVLVRREDPGQRHHVADELAGVHPEGDGEVTGDLEAARRFDFERAVDAGGRSRRSGERTFDAEGDAVAVDAGIVAGAIGDVGAALLLEGPEALRTESEDQLAVRLDLLEVGGRRPGEGDGVARGQVRLEVGDVREGRRAEEDEDFVFAGDPDHDVGAGVAVQVDAVDHVTGARRRRGAAAPAEGERSVEDAVVVGAEGNERGEVGGAEEEVRRAGAGSADHEVGDVVAVDVVEAVGGEACLVSRRGAADHDAARAEGFDREHAALDRMAEEDHALALTARSGEGGADEDIVEAVVVQVADPFHRVTEEAAVGVSVHSQERVGARRAGDVEGAADSVDPVDDPRAPGFGDPGVGGLGADHEVIESVAVEVTRLGDRAPEELIDLLADDRDAVAGVDGEEIDAGGKVGATEEDVHLTRSLAPEGVASGGADREVFDTVAVEVARAAQRLADAVARLGATDREAVGAVEGGEIDRGGEGLATEEHADLAGVVALGEGGAGSGDGEIVVAVVVEVTELGDGGAELVLDLEAEDLDRVAREIDVAGEFGRPEHQVRRAGRRRTLGGSADDEVLDAVPVHVSDAGGEEPGFGPDGGSREGYVGRVERPRPLRPRRGGESDEKEEGEGRSKLHRGRFPIASVPGPGSPGGESAWEEGSTEGKGEAGDPRGG